MRIALLSYEYPPETGFGGIGTYAYYQARGLAKLGHDVHVFAGSLTEGIYHSEHEGVKVTRIKRTDWVDRSLQSLRDRRCGWAQNRIGTGYAAYLALAREHGKRPFDVVEFPECGADGLLVTTLLPDLPSAVKFHSPARLIMDIYDTPKMDREITAVVEQIPINQATLRMSCSRFLADETITRMAVPEPVHVVPNGIDLELFDRDDGIDVFKKFGLPKDKDAITVFFANRMEPRKGIHLVRDMCFSVMTKFPHVHFAFAGADHYGFMEREIQPFIKKNKLKKRFHYFGKLDLPDVRAILKQIDIFLIPSLWENCPYSCIEAMSAGRAIVSSDCGGMPELIQEGQNGVLAKNDDSSSFIARLEEMIEDPALRERCGTAARRVVEERLTDTAIAQKTVDLFRQQIPSLA
ncbi:MAG: glycosyltransferase family 4 protein [Planctomycetota bacterium]